MKFLALSVIFIYALVLTSYAETDSLIIKLKDGNINKIAVSQIQKIQFENITDVDDNNYSSHFLVANGNYPNPFAEQTNIEFEIASTGNVVVVIYDNTGKQIQKLECDNCQIGKNTLLWNCYDENNNKVRGGVYYYEIHLKNEVQSKKMILIK